ncbi:MULTISPECIES: GntR family transcriptional regulator [unclassified Crossiella]|uniref:GntR family transcriptional regulator n=1 Tax=unclassified Crossiella TaxID=2620835 RepID=UPI001FFFC946|nr:MULTISPECIES: GntR family transcriptional regulator [unclassified Crossiella]MCK2237165.1 GntR family transcriptional regulator [Crossiella sp. S99.2]MCK2252524.1 GntR family transcriptional regulator [Crossiella sp. S99.1]
MTTYLYRDIADKIRAQITSEELRPGDPIPSDRALVQEFSASLGSVRKAVSVLREEGLIQSLQGRGSFVRDRHRTTRTYPRSLASQPASHPGAAVGLTDPDAAAWTPHGEPLTYRVEADRQLASLLGIAEHTPVFVCDTVHVAEGGRKRTHRLYVPFTTASAIPELKEHPFRDPNDLYGILAGHGTELDMVDYVTAVMPTPDDAATLNIPPATPMLVIRRQVRDENAHVWAAEEIHICADAAQLAYPVRPAALATS